MTKRIGNERLVKDFNGLFLVVQAREGGLGLVADLDDADFLFWDGKLDHHLVHIDKVTEGLRGLHAFACSVFFHADKTILRSSQGAFSQVLAR